MNKKIMVTLLKMPHLICDDKGIFTHCLAKSSSTQSNPARLIPAVNFTSFISQTDCDVFFCVFYCLFEFSCIFCTLFFGQIFDFKPHAFKTHSILTGKNWGFCYWSCHSGPAIFYTGSNIQQISHIISLVTHKLYGYNDSLLAGAEAGGVDGVVFGLETVETPY